jgi:prevent-host-death family protein
MRTISATDASRRFSDLLDAIEAGETVRVTRGNRPIAEIRPAPIHDGRELREALEGSSPPDERFAESIAEAMELLTMEGEDPWAGE